MKWILVLMLFAGDDVVDSKILGGESQEMCEKARSTFLERAKAVGVDLWGKCVELDRAAPPPKPNPNQFDGPMRDGKRRGSDA